MPHDAERVAEVRAWLVKAAADERAAIHELEARPPLTGDTCFHAQQLAEKAMKAFLVWHDVSFRKTHDRFEIGRQCQGIDPSLRDVTSKAQDLSVFAWLFRYPGETSEPPTEEARQFLRTAQEVQRAVLQRLSLPRRP